MSGYTTRDVADLVGLTPAQIRRYVHRGLLAPRRGARGEFRFGFQDMVVLRTAKGLRDATVTSRRAFAALRALRESLDASDTLTSLRIMADGGNVVVREEDGLWNAETGQGHLDFSVRDLAGQVAQLRQRHFTESSEQGDSDDWFDLGVDLEEVDRTRAADAYRRALELDAGNVDAHVNLGRLLQVDNRSEDARQHYVQALDQQPEHQLALYNLGTLFDEHGELDAAIECYSRADAVADAHYNLCRIFEMRGDQVAALRHLRTYQRLQSRSGVEDRDR